MTTYVTERLVSIEERLGRATRVIGRPQVVATREQVLADRAVYMAGRPLSNVWLAAGRQQIRPSEAQEHLLTASAGQLDLDQIGELYKLLGKVVRG
ncbi:hypothetical protein IPG36_02275 [bacterium]|nr:MAG: hypothetical protein IPG36_02275 [bacterium]